MTLRARHTAVVGSIVDAIGSTPLVELGRIAAAEGVEGRILAKLDHLNPGFSKKDRIALEIVREARADGSLREAQTVVELTSGNTGTGLAIVCRAYGHPFVAVMSRGNTPERARMMRALGAEVVLVDQAPGGVPGRVSGDDLALVEATAREVASQRAAFRADQFALRANVLAHERHTGPEIWDQSGGSVTAFVDFVGSGGTFTGVARALLARNPAVGCWVVEPSSAAVLAGHAVTDPGHVVQGGGYSMPDLALLDRSLVTGYLQVTDAEAVRCARLLAREEGVFAGPSSGANLAAALQVLTGPAPGAAVAFVVCDSGLKYLSTDLWE